MGYLGCMTDSEFQGEAQQRESVPPTPLSLEGFQALGFFAADYAAVESGKLYVSGGYWTVLRFSAFPATFPTCALAAVIRVPFHASQADHRFYMGLHDSERRPLALQIEGEFRIAPSIESRYGEPGVIPFAVPVHGLTFEQPGDYSFFLQVDSTELSRYPFRVIQTAGARFGPTTP